MQRVFTSEKYEVVKTLLHSAFYERTLRTIHGSDDRQYCQKGTGKRLRVYKSSRSRTMHPVVARLPLECIVGSPRPVCYMA